MPNRHTAFLFALALASTAPAEPKERPKNPPAAAAKPQPKRVPADLARLQRALESGSEAEIRAALAEIRRLGPDGASAAPLVSALLGRGASAAVLIDALETAGAVGAASSSDAIAPYVQHRKAEIRRAAAEALASTKGPAAVAALRRALGSSDPALRSSAARGLGVLGAREAVDDLFTVLGRNTPEAALSIAMLCAPEQCDRLVGLIGKLPFELLEPAFLPLLLRPASALPDANKLRLVDRLRRLATDGAERVLRALKAQLPADASPALRDAIDAAIERRPAKGAP